METQEVKLEDVDLEVDGVKETPEPSKAKEESVEELKDRVEKQEKELEEEIEVFEPRVDPVERTLTIGNDSKVFIQRELSYFNKLKFFRLLSGSIRLASEDEKSGVNSLLQDIFGGVRDASLNQDDSFLATEFVQAIMRLIELVPDFAEELYLLALGVKPKDKAWVLQSFEEINDEEGFDILELFIEQNGGAIRRFFDLWVPKMAKKFNQVVMTPGEEETTE